MSADLTPAEEALGDALGDWCDRAGLHRAMIRPYGVAADLLKAVRPLAVADELDAIATELRRRPQLRGVPATVDARWLEARAAALRSGKTQEDHTDA
jgi:hypothetical protein